MNLLLAAISNTFAKASGAESIADYSLGHALK